MLQAGAGLVSGLARRASCAPGELLLMTSFSIPAASRDLVVRERLLDLVRRGVQGPLTLVSAPAGSGKTVLLASWTALGEVRGPVVWIAMDEGEDWPGVFWSYVVDGLQRGAVDVSGVVVPAREHPSSRSALALLASHVAAHQEPVVLIVDAGNYLVDAELGGDLAFFLRHCDRNLRVVLLTRADPALPLHRYRLEGAVVEIRAADLAFSEAEAAALTQRTGLDLSAAQVAALIDRTGGWAAGLKFAAMSLAGGADIEQAISDFTGDEGDVAAYLVAEFLDGQPPEIRDTLLRTSLVSQLFPGLVEALTGRPHGQRVLEFMAHANSFVQPEPGSHGCHRYQSLFREFLRAQLAYEQPALVPQLHHLAADWLAQNGFLRKAIHHAAAAGAWSDAAGYLIDDLGIGSLVTDPEGPLLRALFAGLPDDEESAVVSIVRAALAITAGDANRCTAELDRAGTQVDGEQPTRARACRLSVSVLQALCATLTPDVEAGLAAVATAEDKLRASALQRDAAHPELEALVAVCKGRLLLWRGDFAAARVVLVEAAEIADEPGCEAVLMEALGTIALVEALNGHLRLATELADRADEVARRSGTELAHHSGPAVTALAWVRMEEYDLSGARHLARLVDAVASHQDTVTSPVGALIRARLLRAQGDPRGARAELRAARAPRPGRALSGWLDRWLGAAEAALLIAEDQPDTAVDAIESLREPDRPEIAVVLQQARLARGETDVSTTTTTGPDEIPLDIQVTARLVQATQSAVAGDTAGARATIVRALCLAAPEGLRRPFLETSPAVRRLLRRGTELDVRHAWLDAPIPATSAPATDPGSRTWSSSRGREGLAPMIVEPLTNKELEVLGHLAGLLATGEIAATMFISVNTVRTHVRSILRKLGATRRNEAVRRAWELQLLAPAVPAPADTSSLTWGARPRAGLSP